MVGLIKLFPGKGVCNITYSPESVTLDFAGHITTLDFKTLKDRADFESFSHFAVDIHPSALGTAIVPKLSIYSLYPLTLGNKLAPRDFAMLGSNRLMFLAHVFIPSIGAISFDDCQVTFIVTDEVTCNVPTKDIDAALMTCFPDRPRLVLTGPTTVAPETFADYAVEYVDERGAVILDDIEIIADATAGYLPKRRINLVKGKGSVRFSATQLTAGDNARIKLGFKNFTNLANISVAVV